MNHYKVCSLLLGLVLACTSHAWELFRSDAQPRFLPIPPQDQKHRLSVEYVFNPHLPSLDRSELSDVLRKAAALLEKHLALQVEFTPIAEAEDIGAVVRSVPPEALASIKSRVFDFKGQTGDWRRLVTGTANALQQSGDDTQRARDFALPYLIAPPKSASLSDFSEALVETQLGRLQGWRSARTRGGSVLIDDSTANEYLMWHAYVGHHTPHHLILTNQIIASAEYVDNSVHSAIRGGVSNGLTTTAKKNSLGAASVVSLFPFVSSDPVTSGLRDGAFDSPDQRNEAIALMVVHELGHLLARHGHPYDNPACVMNPPPLLHFKRWMQQLDPASCKVGSSKAMKVGALRFLDTR
ncbi:MAG: hypothetical protein ACT4NV_00745 [Rhodoferax sp.]